MRKSAVPLVGEFAMIIAIMWIATLFTIPSYITGYPFIGFIITGLVFGSRVNAVIVVPFVIAILPPFLFPFETVHSHSAGLRIEDYLTFTGGLIFWALTVGFAGDYVRQLEREQKDALARAVEQKRLEISAETHRQLSSVIEGIGREVQALLARFPHVASSDFKGLEARSRGLKQELRAILNYLDE